MPGEREPTMLVQRTEQEPDLSTAGLAVFFAGRGDPLHGATLLQPGMSFPVSSLNDYDLSVFRAHLLDLGIVLVDDGHGELIADVATSCLYCRQEHAVGDHECVGASPADEVDEEETGRMCAICFKAVAGPPFPFCCSGRARLIKKVTGSGPFKACPACRGKGAEAGCRVCEGTGVSL